MEDFVSETSCSQWEMKERERKKVYYKYLWNTNNTYSVDQSSTFEYIYEHFERTR